MDTAIVIVPINPHTDADSTHRPKEGWTLVSTPSVWLTKLATRWMSDRDLHVRGARYQLDRLPDGYCVYTRPNPSNPALSTNHLYGHPNRLFFDSPNRFYPHFKHLMDHGNNHGCPCTVCHPIAGTPAPMKGGADKAHRIVPSFVPATPRPSMRALQVDDEGIPDVMRHLINRLKRESVVDTLIEEKMSMDWRAERGCLPEMFQKLSQRPTWMPRIGELVLFVRKDARFDPSSKEYKIFDEKEGIFKGFPNWEAGVVTQLPAGQVTFDGIMRPKVNDESVVFAGFRVEPYPDPNGTDRAFTKQYTYVSPSKVRPFAFFYELLRGARVEDAHPTISNAGAVMSSVSLVDRYHFKGKWPVAAISCRGIFIGAEFIAVGDVVRIMPEDGVKDVTDVLYVNSIKLSFTDLDKASDNDYDRGQPHNSNIYLYGRAFTRDHQRTAPIWKSFKNQQDELGQQASAVMSGYGAEGWMPLHSSSQQLRVSFTRILGRLYDANAMQSWFPSVAQGTPKKQASETADKLQLLSKGVAGVQSARKFSSGRDKRILDGKTWFWGDSRAETLGVETLNSATVTYYDEERDFEQFDRWRSAIKVLEKTASVEERKAVNNETTLVADNEAHLSRQKKRLKPFGGMGLAEGVTSSTDSEQEEVVNNHGHGRASEVFMTPERLS